jgi:hypothetical protein
MKRYHEELPRIRREHRLHLTWNHGWPTKPVDCICDLQAGRFRKNSALGCRSKYCRCCKYYKKKKEPSVREQRTMERVKLELQYDLPRWREWDRE